MLRSWWREYAGFITSIVLIIVSTCFALVYYHIESTSDLEPVYKKDYRTGICFALHKKGIAVVDCHKVEKFLERPEEE